jgi:type I restriction enzyme S subunit
MGGYVAYPEYKDSGVEWLGDVPKHWEVWKVTHGFNKIGSGTTPKSDNSLYYDGDIPWVTTSELRESIIYDTSQKVTAEAVRDYSALRKYETGSLIIAMYGATIGRLGIIGVESSVNQACCVYSWPTVFDTRFFYYWLWMRRPILISLSSGGGQPNLSQDDLKKLWVPIPSIEEQQTIARFLDYKTVQIDALIAKKELLLKKLAQKRTALISHAVTKGLDPSVPMKNSGMPWLGEVPAHWTLPPLYTRYSIELGKMLNENRISGKYLVSYLRNIDVQWDSINLDDLPEMDISAIEYNRYLVRTGDLLVCEGGEVGRAAIVGNNIGILGFQKALHRFRALSSDEIPRFMFYILYWVSNIGLFMAEGNPNTIPHLTGEKLRRYRFPKPTIEEQQSISNYLDVQTGKLNSQSEKILQAINKLKEYRTSLITHAVTGKIDVRNVPIPKQPEAEAA